ncbi:pilus assembly protein PilM [Candidatus Parcubacteria bacterium]|nr:pilus assembly protein PilM [Candidatus Parcubacteria bacterium]
MHYKKIVGIDISDFSVEIVEMEKGEDTVEIVNFNRVLLEKGVVEKGKIKNKAKLRKEISIALAQAKNGPINTKDIVFALPDNFLYTHFFEVASDIGDLNREVFNEAVKIVPLPKKNLAFVYKKIDLFSTDKEKIQIFLAATDKSCLKEWQNFFYSLKLSPIVFDIEVLALFRGIYNNLPKEPICLLDMGANSINFAVFTNAGLIYNYQTQYGGNYITEKLAQSLRFDYEKIEKYKKKNNLFLSLRKEERGVLENVFTHIIEEVKRNIAYFNKNYTGFGKIKQLVLAGGVSETKGILDFFQKNFQKNKVILVKDCKKDSNLEPVYFEAIGLAKRLFSERWENDLAFFVKNDLAKINKNKELFYNIYNKINIKRFKENINFKLILLIFLTITASILFIKAFSANPANDMEIINEVPAAKERQVPRKEIEEIVKSAQGTSKKIKVKEIGSNLNVRKGAGSEYAIIGSIAPRAVHEIFKEENGWYKIVTKDNQEGWIYAKYTEEVLE